MNRSRTGFTLVELVLVLFILSLAAMVLLPRLPGLSQGRIDAALRRLAISVQAAYEDASFKKKLVT